MTPRAITPARTARKLAGYGLSAAARRLGISPGYLASLETGRSRWPERRVDQACKLYNCSFVVFLATGTAKARGKRGGRVRCGNRGPAPRETGE